MCFHVTCRLRLSSPQHAQHSGRRSRAPPRGGHRMVYKALSPSGSFCFLPSSQRLLLCISSVTDILFFFFSSPGFSSKGEPRNWPGIQGSFPFLFISSLLSLSSASEKKNPWAKLVKTDLSLHRGRKRDLGRPNNNYFKRAGRRGRFE